MGGASRTSVAVGAGPDELEAVLAFDFGEGCVDRSGEARVVQLDRDVVAVLLGALLPGRTELDVAGVDAVVRSLVGGVFDAGDAGLDVEGKRADLAVEAGFGGGEGADRCHCGVPFVGVVPRPSRPRWLSKGPGTIGPHPRGPHCASRHGVACRTAMK